MRVVGSLLAVALAVGSLGWGLQAPTSTKRATAKSGSKRPAGKKSSSKKSSSKKSSSKKSSVRRQTEPDAERSREIQEALAREGYLTSKPSGKWDATTSDAFSRYQRDKGLPVTGKPESRALIKLGLGGPNHTQ